MALQSILEITNRACDELGLQRPGTSGLVASTAPQDRQMLALLHQAGEDLLRDHDWSNLYATCSITLATASVSYSLPSDFERLVEDTGWDRTNQFPTVGNIPIQKHQYWLSSLVVAPTTRKEFRLFIGNSGSTLYIHPEPQAAEELSFIYIKKNWLTDVNGANPASQIAADTDLTLFKPELMVKELKWRFRAAKGLDAAGFKLEADNFKDLLLSRDTAQPMLNMGGRSPAMPFDFVNIPDGNWDL